MSNLNRYLFNGWMLDHVQHDEDELLIEYASGLIEVVRF